jgi:hypothetical protein
MLYFMFDLTARIQSHIEVDLRICIWIWIRNRIETNTDPKHRYVRHVPLYTGWSSSSPVALSILIVINKLA